MKRLAGILARRSSAIRPYRWMVDVALALALFSGVTWFYPSDHNPYKKDWSKSTFYERYYGVVVMSVCGRGWESPKLGRVPKLDAFLYQQTDSFDCNDLPAEVERTRLNYQASNYYYLFKTVEFVWRLMDNISWSGLNILLGVLCGLVTSLYYALFRIGMGRFLSLAGSLAVLPLHIVQVAGLRDYSKAPFFLLVFIALGFLVRGPYGPKRTIVLATGAGLATGTGLGFREDILIVVPLVLIALVFFLPVPWRGSSGLRLVAVVTFLGSMLLARAPLVGLPEKRVASTHVALLGLTNRFGEALGVENSLYDWSDMYSDRWPEIQVRSYARYQHSVGTPVGIFSDEYSRFGRRLLLEIVRDHPADFILRSYASVIQLLKTPLAFSVLFLVLVALDWRRGLFLGLFALYFGGYPAVQFHPRHYFHLEFLPLWFAGLVLHLLFGALVRGVRTVRRDGGDALRSRLVARLQRARKPVAIALVVGPVVLLGTLILARAYQAARVTERLERYERAVVRELSLEQRTLDDGRLLLVPDDDFLARLPTRSAYDLRVGYLVASVGEGGCTSPQVRFTLRYALGAQHDFSREISMDSARASRIFAPIYSRNRRGLEESPFVGVETSVEDLDCLSFSAVADLAQLAPIPYIELPEDWRSRDLYQRLKRIPGVQGHRSLMNTIRFRLGKMLMFSRESRQS